MSATIDAEVCILLLLAHLLSGTRIANAPIRPTPLRIADITSLEYLSQRGPLRYDAIKNVSLSHKIFNSNSFLKCKDKCNE